MKVGCSGSDRSTPERSNEKAPLLDAVLRRSQLSSRASGAKEGGRARVNLGQRPSEIAVLHKHFWSSVFDGH